MSTRFWGLALFLMSLIWLTLFNNVLVTNAEMQKASLSEEALIEQCAKLKGQQKSICIEVIEKRTTNFNAYKNRHEKYIEILQDARKKLLSRLTALQKKEKGNVKPSIAAYRLQGRIVRIEKLIKNDHANQEKTYVKVSQNLAGTVELIRQLETNTKYLCKVRDIGQVDCVSLSAILAVYDNELGKYILNDLRRLTQVWQMDSRNQILAECAPGIWIGRVLPDAFLFNFEQFLGAEGGVSILNACTKVLESLGQNMGAELAGANGFSGITGIDSQGLGVICGLRNSTASPSEIADNMLNQFVKNCDGNSLFGTVMEGDDELDLEPIPTDSTTVETVTDNGDGTETVKTTTTAGGSTTTTSYVRYRTDIPSGTTTTTKRDSQGNVRQVTTTDADGRKVDDTKYSNDGNSKVETTYDSDGNVLTKVKSTKQAGGRWEATKWKIGNGKWKKVRECDLEACSQCSAMLDSMSEFRTNCASSGGRSFACQAFGGASDCCSTPGDPRVTYPNPEGSYACSGDTDVDLTEGMCSTMCSVAYSEDCNANCMALSSRKKHYQFGLNDPYCIYAISDECFISSDFYIPQKLLDGLKRGPIPLPAPEVLTAMEALIPELFLDAAMKSGREHIFKHVIVAPKPGKNSPAEPKVPK